MKLSNKILFGFFGFIFLYMNAVFAEFRFRGTPTLLDDSNSIAETAAIPEVTHLVIHNLHRTIKVSGSDQPRLEIRTASGGSLKKLKYGVSGDTLTLMQLETEENERLNITVHVPAGSLAGITVNGAEVSVEALKLSSLSIAQNGGRIAIEKDNRIETLRLEASGKARFNLLGGKVDTLSAMVDNSEALVYTPVRLLRGALQNSSYMRMAGVEEIQFRKDKSSTLHFY